MKPISIILIFVFLIDVAFSQPLMVDTNYNPITMIEDFFNTDNVSVSNVQFVGEPISMAFFESQGSGLMVNSGLMISTGTFFDAPYVPPFFASTNLITGGDVDISLAVSGASYDASVIEFDFVVNTTESLDFTYVFASEEYPEYVGSQFNDAFIFILSGGEYSGGYSTGGVNISTIPFSGLPVAINNVNMDLNSEYYIDNLTSNNYISYDGMTTALPADFVAEAGVTYHIKIVVADVSDHIYDSAVFLGYNSLGNPDSLVPPAQFEFSILDNGNDVELNNLSKYARDYHWDFGNGTSSDERYPDIVCYGEPGEYEVKLITQNYCCSDTFITNIVIDEVLSLGVNVAEVQDVSCFGLADGSISLFVNGGVEPYTITWAQSMTGFTIDNLAGGMYIYVVTDALGTIVEGQVVVDEPEAITIETIMIASTEGLDNGSAWVEVDGGTQPYQYLWSTGDTTAMITDVGEGNYSVEIMDGNGCLMTAEIEVSSIEVLSISFEFGENPLLCNGDVTTLIINTQGGVAPYNVTVTPEVDFANISAGTYIVTVIDAAGTTIQHDLIIDEPLVLESDITSVDVTGNSLGQAVANVTGGVEPYTYLWSNGETTQMINDLVEGTYSIQILDVNGCLIIGEVTISVIVGIDDLLTKEVSLYPNPATSQLAITWDNIDLLKGVKVYDINGVVYNLSYNTNDEQVDLNIETLPGGIYYLELQLKNGSKLHQSFVKI